jgi:hypothetical protein
LEDDLFARYDLTAQLLEELAQGAPAARLTRAVRAALDRIKARPLEKLPKS